MSDAAVSHAAIEAGLLRLKWLRAALVLERALKRHAIALKANFDPNQPRVPAGNPDGGQWIDGGGSSIDKNTELSRLRRRRIPGIGHNEGPPLQDPPELPQESPPTIQEKNAYSKQAARWIEKAIRLKGPVGAFLAIVEAIQWFDEEQRASIYSYQDPPKTIDELRTAVSKNRRKGYQDHHIVEQSAEDETITESKINSPENIVRIPTWKHRDISDWYSSTNIDPRIAGRPRDHLRGKSWDERFAFGLDVLRRHGVLKP